MRYIYSNKIDSKVSYAVGLARTRRADFGPLQLAIGSRAALFLLFGGLQSMQIPRVN